MQLSYLLIACVSLAESIRSGGARTYVMSDIGTLSGPDFVNIEWVDSNGQHQTATLANNDFRGGARGGNGVNSRHGRNVIERVTGIAAFDQITEMIEAHPPVTFLVTRRVL